VVHAVLEARRASPAILFLPHLQLWWETAPASLRATLTMLLSDLPPELPLLLLATADVPLADLDADALKLFGSGGQPSSQPNSCLLILLNKICNMHPCNSCFLLSSVASLDAQSVDSRPSLSVPR